MAFQRAQSKSMCGSTVLVCVPTSTSSWSILYDEAGDEKSQMAERTEMGRIGTRRKKRKRETG